MCHGACVEIRGKLYGVSFLSGFTDDLTDVCSWQRNLSLFSCRTRFKMDSFTQESLVLDKVLNYLKLSITEKFWCHLEG